MAKGGAKKTTRGKRATKEAQTPSLTVGGNGKLSIFLKYFFAYSSEVLYE